MHLVIQIKCSSHGKSFHKQKDLRTIKIHFSSRTLQDSLSIAPTSLHLLENLLITYLNCSKSSNLSRRASPLFVVASASVPASRFSLISSDPALQSPPPPFSLSQEVLLCPYRYENREWGYKVAFYDMTDMDTGILSITLNFL